MNRKKRLREARSHLGRVLVVEDDAVLALAIELALLDAGAMSVARSSTIAGALETLVEGKPDGIVLDVHLADRADGWALAELVDQLGPPHPRIIFSTGSPHEIPPSIAGKGIVLEKPYEPSDVVEALRAHAPNGLFGRLRAAIG